MTLMQNFISELRIIRSCLPHFMTSTSYDVYCRKEFNLEHVGPPFACDVQNIWILRNGNTVKDFCVLIPGETCLFPYCRKIVFLFYKSGCWIDDQQNVFEPNISHYSTSPKFQFIDLLSWSPIQTYDLTLSNLLKCVGIPKVKVGRSVAYNKFILGRVVG